ncbi:MAG TPA: GntR family transcriptional regulator [Anaerolineae bacterium]|nr:GntR family transcriptional regulator [Anaerolineae bacterium]
MQTDPLQPVDIDTLRTRVTDSVRQAILQGVLLPGEQVNQVQIAAKLRTSRGPVREALRQLEEEGLVQSYPHKGTFVTEITPNSIEEVYSIRRVLETFAVRRMIEHGNEANVQQLREIVRDMERAVTAGDSTLLNELDFQFHAAICRGAQHSLLMQLWKSIEVGVRRVVALRHGIYENLSEIVGNHPDLLAAIEAGDAPLASQLLDEHIREAGEQVYDAWVNKPPAQRRPVLASQDL